jgi:hypothetical protein
VHFEYNGQSYMLSFNPVDERWYLLTPGFDGQTKVIPVRDEKEISVGANFPVPTGLEGTGSVN